MKSFILTLESSESDSISNQGWCLVYYRVTFWLCKNIFFLWCFKRRNTIGPLAQKNSILHTFTVLYIHLEFHTKYNIHYFFYNVLRVLNRWRACNFLIWYIKPLHFKDICDFLFSHLFDMACMVHIVMFGVFPVPLDYNLWLINHCTLSINLS